MEHKTARAEGRPASGTAEAAPPPRLIDGRRLEALVAAAAHASARDLIQAATRHVVDLLGERGSCLLLDGGARVVLATHAPGLNNLPVDLARYPEVKLAVDTGGVVAIEDAHADARLEPVRELLPRRLGSVAVVPLVVGEHRMGVLMAQSTEPRAMPAEARATAALIGQVTALLLEARLGRRVDLVFTAEVPAYTAPPQAAGPGAADDGRADRKRVLIVEDDPDHSAAVSAALRHGGYEVEIAADGVDGVRRAREHRPDMVLLDVCLPVLDGLSVAERLREDPLTRETPILFLRGVDELLPRVHALTFDKVDFLPRSHALRDLLARVERSLSR